MKRRYIILLRMILFLYVTIAVVSNVDYSRIRNNKNPIFSIGPLYILDGGTHMWIGLGYFIDELDKFQQVFHNDELTISSMGKRQGHALTYLIPIWPLINRETSRVMLYPESYERKIDLSKLIDTTQTSDEDRQHAPPAGRGEAPRP